MSAKEALSNSLKRIRGSIAVKDLAKRVGLGHTSIYKAEDPNLESPLWKTIETAYGDLCSSPDEYINLLMTWAIAQSERPVAAMAARVVMDSVVRDEAHNFTSEHNSILREMELMPPADQRRFANFAKHYRRSENTRRMCDVWMESSEEWMRELGKED
ncbi:MAG: hypothetical protein EOP85_01840 [Verrucomicrobiaceae bacterium]|nr:MAG: hypothetical protein EOP85_01840 [Verrucomicrobiaceae bacterium]